MTAFADWPLSVNCAKGFQTGWRLNSRWSVASTPWHLPLKVILELLTCVDTLLTYCMRYVSYTHRPECGFISQTCRHTSHNLIHCNIFTFQTHLWWTGSTWLTLAAGFLKLHHFCQRCVHNVDVSSQCFSLPSPSPLSLSRPMWRLQSCIRKHWLGQTSMCGLTAATASCRLRPSAIIRKASTNVAERLTPIRQWTNTRPGIVMFAVNSFIYPIQSNPLYFYSTF